MNYRATLVESGRECNSFPAVTLRPGLETRETWGTRLYNLTRKRHITRTFHEILMKLRPGTLPVICARATNVHILACHGATGPEISQPALRHPAAPATRV